MKRRTTHTRKTAEPHERARAAAAAYARRCRDAGIMMDVVSLMKGPPPFALEDIQRATASLMGRGVALSMARDEGVSMRRKSWPTGVEV